MHAVLKLTWIKYYFLKWLSLSDAISSNPGQLLKEWYCHSILHTQQWIKKRFMVGTKTGNIF